VVSLASAGATVSAQGSVRLIQPAPSAAVLRSALDGWLASVGSLDDLRAELSVWLGTLPPRH
jgi:hypothetical protein